MAGNLVETLIGAVVLAVAGFFLFFAYNKTQVTIGDGYQVVARFDNVDGIRVGSDVMMSGIKVGTVVGQSLDKESYLAVLRMSISDDIKLPEDSSIKVSSVGLLGDNFLEIQPGGSDQLLQSGGEIRYTQGAVDILDLLGRAIYSATGGGGGGQQAPAGGGPPAGAGAGATGD